MTKYKVLHRRLVEGVVENQKTPIDITSPARDLKPGPPNTKHFCTQMSI
jgi:hypothetical protein